jgi:hypothetical protein
MIWTLMAVKTASKGGEFGVANADKEPKPLDGIVEVHGQVAGLLGQPCSGRGDAEDVDAAGGVLVTKNA